MAINDPTADQSGTRQPRLRIMSSGQALPAVSVSVTQNSHYQPDRFNIEFPLNANGGQSLGWWGDQDKIEVDIQISLDGGTSFTSMVIGELDRIDAHPATGIISAEGRDFTARLVEAKTQETFLNQTSSQVATTLALRHDLTPVVTATTTLVSRFYQQDHDKITLGQFSRTTTEWDLLTNLAQQEGFDVFMQGRELHFQPATDPGSDPYVVSYDTTSGIPRSNTTDLQLGRSLTLAKDIEVQVRSWHSAKGVGFTKTARAIGARSASSSSSSGETKRPQRYVFVRPNLSEDQAQKLANSMLADLSKHERTVTVTMPGELSLSPRQMVAVQGTNSSWDQAYFIADITRRLSMDEGFQMTVNLKNHTVESQATA